MNCDFVCVYTVQGTDNFYKTLRILTTHMMSCVAFGVQYISYLCILGCTWAFYCHDLLAHQRHLFAIFFDCALCQICNSRCQHWRSRPFADYPKTVWHRGMRVCEWSPVSRGVHRLGRYQVWPPHIAPVSKSTYHLRRPPVYQPSCSILFIGGSDRQLPGLCAPSRGVSNRNIEN